jgi:hypothetical protein
MLPLLPILLPALLPVLSDAIRGIFTKLTGGAGAQPANVDEAVKLMEAEAKRAAAMAQLDAPAANISKWVADLRASFRYLAAAMIILAAYGMLAANGAGWITVDKDVLAGMLDMSSSAFSFVFGDRMYSYLRRR